MDRFLINRTAAKLLCHQHCTFANVLFALLTFEFISVQHSATIQNKPYRQSTRCFQALEVNDIVATVAKRVQEECDDTGIVKLFLFSNQEIWKKFTTIWQTRWLAYFKRRVEVELQCWDGEAEAECEKIEMVYIPVHLEDITYNIIKNAMRATIQHNQNQDTLPSVKVLISKLGYVISLSLSFWILIEE